MAIIKSLELVILIGYQVYQTDIIRVKNGSIKKIARHAHLNTI